MNPPLFHNRICKVCSLVAATLILPTLAYAQNNQGNGPGINPGVPNGTYSFTESGYVSGQVPLAGAGRLTFFANGTTSGVASFSVGGTVYSGVTFAGTFTVNADGSVSAKSTTSQGEVVSEILYPTPDSSTIAFVQTDASFGGPGTLTARFFAPSGPATTQNQLSGEMKGRIMNPLIQLKETAAVQQFNLNKI
jgi:hypothetical protein